MNAPRLPPGAYRYILKCGCVFDSDQEDQPNIDDLVDFYCYILHPCSDHGSRSGVVNTRISASDLGATLANQKD
jgi:hypothetical protein